MGRLQDLIESMTSIIKTAPEEDWKEKARIICRFAEKVSERIMQRTRIVDMDSDSVFANTLVYDFEGDWLLNSPDTVRELQLMDIRPQLDNAPDEAKPAYSLAFGKGRVCSFINNGDNDYKIIDTITYEEATRTIIFWLEDKILQIIRVNHWDRVSSLVDVYDRMVDFFNGI